MSPSQNFIVDWNSLAENFDNDKFAIALVVDAFLESASESLDKVRQAVQSGEGKAIAMTAHSLKGAILNFGAQMAVSQAQALENHGYGEPGGNAKELFAGLEHSVAQLVAELNNESHRYRE